MAEDKTKRIRELIGTLRAAGRAYYQESREIMSNFEYDRMYDELSALEKESELVLAGSPTQKVGYEVLSELPKQTHPSPMLSLDKTKQVDELSSWLGGKEGILSWKMDGLTVVLTYENGELLNAGYPQVVSGRMVFDDNNAEYFSQIMRDLAEDGADIIGGCCGTTPEYIRQMVLKTADVVHKKNASIEEEISEKKTANDVSFYKGKEGRKLIAVELAPPLGIDDEKIMP